ncbi:hypothetical protein EOE18_02645 [Novosphingobium umbonatum]|uniref:Uncharacterized protein n=1 Tax=Novosphingobium umbonatum TaxID=1908524 RepID=A0A437NAD1_9SPHN|nr:hypothetical protein [Novosphingobium umbonatum]RVU06879.1 hypothetical protein EOE18_02645 [Novosphingobium umbonatum]
MSQSPAQNSDAILAAAKASLQHQRAGGRRSSGPIGQRSAALHRAGQKRKAAKLFLTLAASALALILVMTLVKGALSLLGMMGGGVALVVALVAGVVMIGLRGKDALTIPTLDSLRASPPRELVGQTQLWLEAQRPALPAPALDLVGQIGNQLDALATQLDRVDGDAPALGQVRQLVGEHLPNLVNAYTAIPPALRGEAHAGQSPDQQLAESLGMISGEINSVTRQLAEGKLDALAVQNRFLGYKYGGETGEA